MTAQLALMLKAWPQLDQDLKLMVVFGALSGELAKFIENFMWVGHLQLMRSTAEVKDEYQRRLLEKADDDIFMKSYAGRNKANLS